MVYDRLKVELVICIQCGFSWPSLSRFIVTVYKILPFILVVRMV